MGIYKTAVWFVLVFYLSVSGIGPIQAAVEQGPVITNSNEKASAYFQLKKADGTNEIVKVAPRSNMQLGPEIVEFQYLYMEGKGSDPALPDIPAMELTHSDFDLPPDIEPPMPPVQESPAEEGITKDKGQKEQVPAKIINQEDKTVVVRAILADNEQHILVLEGLESMDLPRRTQWVELRRDKTVGVHNRKSSLVKIEKSDGDSIEISEFGKRIPIT